MNGAGRRRRRSGGGSIQPLLLSGKLSILNWIREYSKCDQIYPLLENDKSSILLLVQDSDLATYDRSQEAKIELLPALRKLFRDECATVFSVPRKDCAVPALVPTHALLSVLKTGSNLGTLNSRKSGCLNISFHTTIQFCPDLIYEYWLYNQPQF